MTLATFESAQRRQQGLTLIAALIGLLIMSIGMTALFRLYIDTRQHSHYAVQSMLALGLARDKLEQLRFASNNTVTGTDTLTLNATSFTRHWQSRDNPQRHTRRIAVTLQWVDSLHQFDLTLMTTIDTLAIRDWSAIVP